MAGNAHVLISQADRRLHAIYMQGRGGMFRSWSMHNADSRTALHLCALNVLQVEGAAHCITCAREGHAYAHVRLAIMTLLSQSPMQGSIATLAVPAYRVQANAMIVAMLCSGVAQACSIVAPWHAMV